MKVPWPDALEGLVSQGWARVVDAVDGGLVEEPADEDRRRWRLLGDEGVVRQHAYGSYLPLKAAKAAVRGVADGLVAGLSGAAGQRGLPALRAFNEVTWGRYRPAPDGSAATPIRPTTAG